MRFSVWASALVLGLSAPVVAQAFKWQQADQLYMPAMVAPHSRTYSKGDTILEVPLVWRNAARLEGALRYMDGGKAATLAAGTVLPRVLVSDPARAEAQVFYCTPSRVREKGATGSLLGMLGKSLANSLNDTQYCLGDTNNDGRFDNAMLVGEGDNDARMLGPVEPLAYSMVSDAPVAADTLLRMKLRSVGKTHIAVELEIVQGGKKRLFDGIDSGGVAALRVTRIPLPASGPAQASVFGTAFEVVRGGAQDTVSIRWLPARSSEQRLVIPSEKVLRSRWS